MEPRIARRAAASALLIGVAADLLFDRASLGISVPIFTVAVLAIVTLFGQDRRPADALDLWLPALAIVASLGPALRTDPAVVTLDLLLVVSAVSAWSFAVSGIAVTRRTARTAAMLGARAAAAVAIGLLWLLARAGGDGFFAAGTRNLGRLGPVARGALIAIPIVVGFSLLLTSADAVFGRAIDAAFHLPIDLDEALGRGTFSILAAIVVAGPLAIATGIAGVLGVPAVGSDAPAQPALESPAAEEPARRSGATETLVVLVAVDVLFALFAIVQVVYLFGGADTSPRSA